jgi:hypothetical protein
MAKTRDEHAEGEWEPIYENAESGKFAVGIIVLFVLCSLGFGISAMRDAEFAGDPRVAAVAGEFVSARQ